MEREKKVFCPLIHKYIAEIDRFEMGLWPNVYVSWMHQWI